MSKSYRCCYCRTKLEDYSGRGRPVCDRCKLERSAPHCLACGEPVVGAGKNDPFPYHEECRRCNSCYNKVDPADVQMLAGRLLCLSCAHLLGKFFAPAYSSEVDQTKEIFATWDSDGSGHISRKELSRVLKALDPDFMEHDIEELLRGVDKDGNGKIDYAEFCDWIMKGENMITLGEDSLEQQVRSLMQEAARARRFARMDVHSVHMTSDGVYFAFENGEFLLESKALHRPLAEAEAEVQKMALGEFIVRVEGTAFALILKLNSGRDIEMHAEGHCKGFGPFQAPEGFCIVGLRTKPTDDGYDITGESGDRIVGVDMAPLQGAASYDPSMALIFAAEQGYLDTLGKLSAKGAPLNEFTPGGATALMLAAQNGSCESMRLLLMAGANPLIADPDGWTAMTFASRFGNGAAVDTLLEKGATESGDGGKALTEALRNKHGRIARKLLTADLGPAKKGTFVLEDHSTECTLPAPIVAPSGGAFNGPVDVEISQAEDDPAPEEGAPSPSATRTRILYTLDGTDPLLLGSKVCGPMRFSKRSTRLRTVAVRGAQQSTRVDAVFNICDYALPDIVVSGTLQIRTFPEAQGVLRYCLAEALKLPREIVHLQHQTGFDGTMSRSVWMQIPIMDPCPKQSLLIDKPFSTVKAANSRRPFIEKFQNDVEKATGSRPAVDNISGRNSIIVDFSLARAEAEEFARQLADPSSFILTKALMRNDFKVSTLEMFEPLGKMLSDATFDAALHGELGSKAEVNEVIAVGTGDSGFIAVSTLRSQVKKIEKKLEPSLKKTLKNYNWSVGEISLHPEETNFDYSINIANNGLVDPSAIIKALNDEDFHRGMEARVANHKASAQIKVHTKASKRVLTQLLVKLKWDFPTPGEESYMDCICLAYADEQLAEVVDCSSSHRGDRVFDGLPSPQARRRALAVSRSIRHSGDVMSETGGMHQVVVDLQAMSPEITDIFFVLSAFGFEDIGSFPKFSVMIYDSNTGNKLTDYNIKDEIHAEAVVMSVLSRRSGRWMVNHLGIPTDGQVGHYEPIRATVANYRAEFLHLERLELIKLKVLLKTERALLNNEGEGDLIHSVMALPLGAFQSIVMCL